ncbi:MAG: N-6 DNA methylase [Prolixibacteraceae bacterium]|jgi:type I restriction enzyme M protein|nr:N-6 DNA methylase [Prolixibacteraceae bacterium]MBT6767019.1 N-6 DNA methylase [Prolixibacteraceae bacterium]MBT6999400.1 N-6 DNA methylase [Prolixibacteraceae bacterium]MBT7394294.1 N-6 DNA methylase [Prolixibacteraceae bacterium]
MKLTQKNIVFPISSKDEYLHVFKNIYYHLYSNSNVSRAEVLIKDISKILLYCLSIDNKMIKGVSPGSILESLKKNHPNINEFFTPFELEDEYIIFVVDNLSEINIGNAPAHIIGDAFQTLVGPNLRGDKGQFFTPKSVVSSMVKILNPEPNSVICDPACGTGGFLIESLSHILTKEQQFEGHLIGIEKDDFLANTANAILEIYTQKNFQVKNENSLDITNPNLSALIGTIDTIITNPPFGAKIGIKDKEILKHFEFGYSWTYIKEKDTYIKTNQILKEQSPQILFLELCVKLLKDGGKAGIVLPEGIFGNKSLGYIWDYLRQNVQVLGMIDCPRTLFQPSTDVKTNILFFEKKKEAINKFKVSVAINCGHDKRGRYSDSNGAKVLDDFIEIGKSFPNVNGVWKEAVIKDKYYVVPRYCISATNWSNKKNYDFPVASFISIKDLVSKKQLSLRKGNEVGSEAYGTGEIPFIRTSDIINLEINYDPTKSISEEFYLKYANLQGIKEFDILMVADGRYRIGKTSMILSGMTKCVVQSHLKILRIQKEDVFSPFELLYILNQKQVIEQIRSLIFIQSTLGSIGNRLNELLLPIPEKSDSWKKQVQEFKSTLMERNILLQRLHNLTYEETF